MVYEEMVGRAYLKLLRLDQTPKLPSICRRGKNKIALDGSLSVCFYRLYKPFLERRVLAPLPCSTGCVAVALGY